MKEKKENIEKELEELSPMLSRLKGESTPDGFNVPPRYFRELPPEVMNRIQRETVSRHPGWWSSLQHFLAALFRPGVAIALAALALAIAAGIYLLAPRPATGEGDAYLFASLTPEEVQTYVNANLEAFDTELVIEMASASPDFSILPADDLNGEELDQYLDDLLQEVDEETIEDIF